MTISPERPNAINWGFYSPKIKEYLRYFSQDQLLVLVYEQATGDIPQTEETLANFLDVMVDRFPAEAGSRKVNITYVPKAQAAYAWAMRWGWYLFRNRWRLDWVVDSAKGLGVERLFGNAGPLPPMKEETRRRLEEIYKDEIEELELLLQVDLECWR